MLPKLSIFIHARKVARLIPIIKARLREIINNYCPVSRLGILSKIVEAAHV